MWKSAGLCTGAKPNLRDRVLGEVEKLYYFARQSGTQRDPA